MARHYGSKRLPYFYFSEGVNLIIQRHSGYPGDGFWDMGQQGDFSETHGLGKAVSETTDQVGTGAYNSDDGSEQKDSKVKFVISKELFILMGIALCKIVLWCLYRSAREDGLDVTNL